MIRSFIAATAVLLALSPALAADATPPADPAQQALAHMLQEAQSREAQALVQAYTLRAQASDLKKALDAEKRRADEAEAKVQSAQPAEPAK